MHRRKRDFNGFFHKLITIIISPVFILTLSFKKSFSIEQQSSSQYSCQQIEHVHLHSSCDRTALGVGVFSCEHLKHPSPRLHLDTATSANWMLPWGEPPPAPITAISKNNNKQSVHPVPHSFSETQKYTTSVGWSCLQQQVGPTKVVLTIRASIVGCNNVNNWNNPF